MRARFAGPSFVIACVSACLGAGVLGCGGGYPEPASGVVEEEEQPDPQPASAAPDDDPKHDDEGDDGNDDVKPKGDPTDDIGDPREQKHDEESLNARPRRATPIAPRRS